MMIWLKEAKTRLLQHSIKVEEIPRHLLSTFCVHSEICEFPSVLKNEQKLDSSISLANESYLQADIPNMTAHNTKLHMKNILNGVKHISPSYMYIRLFHLVIKKSSTTHIRYWLLNYVANEHCTQTVQKVDMWTVFFFSCWTERI